MSTHTFAQVAAALAFIAVVTPLASGQTIEPIDQPAIFSVPYPSASHVVNVADGAALEAALSTAQGGDVITLQAGQIYRPTQGTRFVLPAVASADDTHWIVIRSNGSVFDASGSIPPNTRVDGSTQTLAQMAKLRSIQASNDPSASVVFTAPGAHHFRLVGLDIAPDDANSNITNIVQLGNPGASTREDLPSSIVIDRSYIHGRNDTGKYLRGVLINGSKIAIIESRFEYIQDPVDNQQANAIAAISGDGPVKIVNNYIDSLGENIIFGGGDPGIEGILFQDLEIRRNHLIKTAAAGTGGACNLFELKMGRRVLVEGNVLERVWSGCQDGTAVLFKSSNQNDSQKVWSSNGLSGCYWCVTEHVTFRNNIIRHVGQCFSAIATNNTDQSGHGYSKPLNHVRIENVVCDDIGTTQFTGASKVLTLNRGGADDVLSGDPVIQHFQVIHLTSITNQGTIVETSGENGSDNKISIAPNFVWQYNLSERHCYGITTGGDEGSVGLNSAWFAPVTYGRSALVNTSESCNPISDADLLAKYPTGTCVEGDWSGVEIDRQTPIENSTYRLAATSPYSKTGSCAPPDGKDMGADADALWDAIDNGPGGSGGPGGGGGGNPTPHLGNPFALPGTVQAEDYDDGGEAVAYHDSDAGNTGGAYRQDDVDIEGTTDTGGGYDVGWFAAGEWLLYSANVQTASTYSLNLRMASPCSGGQVHLEANGQNVSGAVTVPNTGAWNAWQTVTVTGISLAAGSATLRLVADTAAGGTCGGAVGNVNWFSLTDGTSGGGGLPSPWHANDIGTVGQAGSSSYASGTFTVKGSGADIWGAADAFQFASRTVTGDTVVIARVVSEQNTNAFAKAGVMIRSSLDANAAHVIVDAKPDGTIEFMTRTTNGGTTAVVATSNQAVPGWLSLVRVGSSVTAYLSTDGSTWTPMGSTTIALPDTTEVGLAVTSHDTSMTNTSTFDNLSVYSPWQNTDVGAVGQTGSYLATNGVFSVSGAGADIWGTADGFQFVYMGNSDNVRIVARVTAVQNTSSFAKAGIMIRQSVAAGAPHAVVDLKPDGTVEFMTRQTADGTTTFLGGTTLATPGWLRLTRTGNTIVAEVSSNGSSWTALGSTTLAFSGTPLVGLVVSSHDTAVLNSSTFDSVSVSEP